MLSPIQNSEGNSSSGELLTRGWWEIFDFWPISETVRHRPMVSMSYIADRIVSIPMTLSDLERQDVKGQTFPEDLHNYTRPVWPRAIKLAVGGRVSRRSVTPHLKEAATQCPPNFLGPCTHTVWPRETKFGLTKSDKIWYGNTRGEEEWF